MTNTINELIKVIDNSINQQEFKKFKLLKTEKGYYSFDSKNKTLSKDSKYEIFWYAYRLYFKSFMYEIGYGDKELLVESKIFLPKYKNIPISPVFYIESINRKSTNQQRIFGKDHTESVVLQVEDEIKYLIENFDHFSTITEDKINNYQKILEEKSLEYQIEQERKDIIYDIHLAEELFHNKDYQGFISKIKKYINREDVPKHIKLMFEYSEKKSS